MYTLAEFEVMLVIICNRIISVRYDKKHILFVVKLLLGLLLRIQYYGSSNYNIFIQLLPPSKPTYRIDSYHAINCYDIEP
jgi:hypothetical protein